jgi:Polyketide cyclase / dehydrase and lipid transport
MVHVNGSMTICRPVETVFDYAANQSNEPTYNPRMIASKKIGEGPVGVGTHFRATVLAGRRPLDMDIEVTEYDRPSRFGTHTAMSSADVSGVLTFRPSGADTLMSWSWDVRPKGVARFFSPLVALMGRRQEKVCWAGLKRVLEADPPRSFVPGKID